MWAFFQRKHVIFHAFPLTNFRGCTFIVRKFSRISQNRPFFDEKFLKDKSLRSNPSYYTLEILFRSILIPYGNRCLLKFVPFAECLGHRYLQCYLPSKDLFSTISRYICPTLKTETISFDVNNIIDFRT